MLFGNSGLAFASSDILWAHMQFSEYDSVRLRHSVSSLPVRAGAVGAVLIVYDADPPTYEVEFFEDELMFIEGIPCSKTIGLFRVLGSDLELLKRLG